MQNRFRITTKKFIEYLNIFAHYIEENLMEFRILFVVLKKRINIKI